MYRYAFFLSVHVILDRFTFVQWIFNACCTGYCWGCAGSQFWSASSLEVSCFANKIDDSKMKHFTVLVPHTKQTLIRSLIEKATVALGLQQETQFKMLAVKK